MPFLCLLRKPHGETSRKPKPVGMRRVPGVARRRPSYRHIVLNWCNDLNRTWSGRGLARALGVSQAYIWKLTRQFNDGRLNVRSPCGGAATFKELGRELVSARVVTQRMKEQGLLRETSRQMIDRVLGRA